LFLLRLKRNTPLHKFQVNLQRKNMPSPKSEPNLIFFSVLPPALPKKYGDYSAWVDEHGVGHVDNTPHCSKNPDGSESCRLG
jgi:hypothetical protein